MTLPRGHVQMDRRATVAGRALDAQEVTTDGTAQ